MVAVGGGLPRSPPRTDPGVRMLRACVRCGMRRSREAVLARISHTHLGGVSSGGDEPGCGSICVALRQSGLGLIV